MATQLKEGDAVMVVDREATPADEKNGTFYNYFRKTTGTLEKIYDDGMTSVVLDEQSLPEAIRDRHQELTRIAKQKWLDSLSGEARNRLTPEEQQFHMRYTILVGTKDLVKQGSKPVQKPAIAAKAEPEATPAAEAQNPAKPVSTKVLDKAEEEFLRARQAAKDK